MKQLQIGSLTCNVAGKNPAHLVYLLFPFDGLEGWATRAAAKYDVTLVSITGMDWDDELTPWPAPGAPAGSAPFKGLAPEFCRCLRAG